LAQQSFFFVGSTSKTNLCIVRPAKYNEVQTTRKGNPTNCIIQKLLDPLGGTWRKKRGTKPQRKLCISIRPDIHNLSVNDPKLFLNYAKRGDYTFSYHLHFVCFYFSSAKELKNQSYPNSLNKKLIVFVFLNND